MKIPLFPLSSVFFPGEEIPLHIFEDRYKQLINDCKVDAHTFGIPAYINDSIAYGTEMKLKEVAHTYSTGEMDVICKANRVFKVLTFENPMEGKLYAGGVVEFLENIEDSVQAQKEKVLDQIGELYCLIGVTF